MTGYALNDIKNLETKPAEPWWYVVILRPLVLRLVYLFANYTKLTPNQITIIGFIFSLASAFSFLQGTWSYLIIGAFLFELGYIFDCVDGRIARLKGLKSDLGDFLDHLFSEGFGKFLAGFGLVYGQYLIDNNGIWIIIGMMFVFIHYLSLSIHLFVFKTKTRAGITISLIEPQQKGDIYNKNLIKKYIDWCKRKRLNFIPFTMIEFGALAFFVGPLINFPKECLIISISLEFVVHILTAIFSLGGFSKIKEMENKQ